MTRIFLGVTLHEDLLGAIVFVRFEILPPPAILDQPIYHLDDIHNRVFHGVDRRPRGAAVPA
jgi:hypothetical protein